MTEPGIRLVAYDALGEELDRCDIEGRMARSMRTWCEEMLRVEDNNGAQQLMLILNAVVHEQAYEAGRVDAANMGESRLTPGMGSPIWRDGYELGFAETMSDLADEREERP